MVTHPIVQSSSPITNPPITYDITHKERLSAEKVTSSKKNDQKISNLYKFGFNFGENLVINFVPNLVKTLQWDFQVF